LETINILEKLSVMFVTPGRTKQPGEFMSGRGMILCDRCEQLTRRYKLTKVENKMFCGHCKAVLIMQLKDLAKIASLSE